MTKKIHIGDISNLIGIPPSTLRFYETHGIIEPLKDADNNYRVYTPDESCRILISKLLKSFGLPLVSVSGMVNSNDYSENHRLLAEEADNIESEIRRLSSIKKELDSYISENKRAVSLLDSTETAFRPGLYRVSNIINGELALKEDVTRIVKKWMKCLPFVHYSLLLDTTEIKAESAPKGEWGFAVTEDFAKCIGETGKAPVVYYPPAECIFTSLLRTSADSMTEHEVETILNRVFSGGYTPSGPILGRFLSVYKKSGCPGYLYLFSIPIKK